MRDPRERLRDIPETITNIERYALRGRQAFEDDELIQNWFVRHLQIIGEAARALPQETRDQAPASHQVALDRNEEGERRKHKRHSQTAGATLQSQPDYTPHSLFPGGGYPIPRLGG